MRDSGVALVRGRRGRIVACTVVVLVLAGASVLVAGQLSGLPSDAAMKVNGTVVTQDELDARIHAFRVLYGVQPPEDELYDQFRRDSAKAVALGIVLDTAASERGITVSDKAARETLSTMLENAFGADGRAQFVELLAAVGASEQQVLDEVKRQQSSVTLLQEVTKDVAEPTDAEVRRAFDDRVDEMVAPERRKLRNIVVASEEHAQEIIEDVRSGVDFAEAVAEHSLDQSTRDSGGDLGFVRKDQLHPDYAAVAFDTTVGKHFGPVETEFGWNVGAVVEIRAKKPLKYAQVKEELRAALTSERQLERWREWLERQLRDADISYADEYQPQEPHVPPRSSVGWDPAGGEGEAPR